MSDPVDLAGLPPSDDGPAPPARPRPRNYLATGERRQLMWRFLPAALAVFLGLTWIEHAWFPRQEPPQPAPVDTRLEAVRGPRPDGDEVLIEAEPEPFVPEAGALGAPASALATVRDDTFFREGDMEAWEQTFLTLREAGRESLRRSPAAPVSFSELFGQPRSFRGRLVRLEGTLHRLERLDAPRNDYGIESYWQGWLEPAGGPAMPIVVHCLEVPEGMPTGMRIDEPVEVTGYFFKRYAYAAADTIRVAPLVMALEPVRKPSAAAVARGSSLGAWVVVSMAVLVGAAVLGVALSARPSGRRRQPAPTDPSAVLADHEPFSVVESLRRLDDGSSHERNGARP